MGIRCCYREIPAQQEINNEKAIIPMLQPNTQTTIEETGEYASAHQITNFETHTPVVMGKALNNHKKSKFSEIQDTKADNFEDLIMQSGSSPDQPKPKIKTNVVVPFRKRISANFQGLMEIRTSSIRSNHDTSRRRVSIDLSGDRKERKGDISLKYDILYVIGKGACGEVRKIRNKTSGEFRAVKIISKSKCQVTDNYFEEFEILKKLDHPNVLKLYEFYQDESTYYVVTEYCEGDDLLSKICNTKKKFGESEILFIMRQIFSAVYYCHNNSIVHRDLKPENILFVDKDTLNLKVIDFGRSKILKPLEKINELAGSVFLYGNFNAGIRYIMLLLRF